MAAVIWQPRENSGREAKTGTSRLKKRYLSTPTRLFHMFYVRQLAVVFQYEPQEPCAHKSSQQIRDQRDTLNNAVTRAAA